MVPQNNGSYNSPYSRDNPSPFELPQSQTQGAAGAASEMQQSPIQGAGNPSPNFWNDASRQAAQQGAAGQPSGIDPFDGGLHTAISKPTEDIRKAADELLMACMRSPEVCAELLPRLKEEYFHIIHAPDLEFMLRVLKQHIANSDSGAQVVGHPNFQHQIKRAIDTAVTLRPQVDRHLLDIEFLEVSNRGSQVRGQTLEWIFAVPSAEISVAAARDNFRKVACASLQQKALTHFRFTHGLGPREVAEHLAKVAAELAALDAPFDTSRKWWTPEEFAAANFTMSWHIPGLLVAGQPCIVGGPAKAMKTSILVDLALSLGKGRDCRFLGHFPVPGPGMRVGFISGESGEATIQETFRRVARTRSIDLAHDNVFKCFRVPPLNQAAELAALTEVARRYGLEVMIIDPLYLGLLAGDDAGKASNLFAMGPLLAALSHAWLSAGCTPIMAHHTAQHLPPPDQSGKYKPITLENLAYAGCHQFARQWLLVNRLRAFSDGTGRHELWLRWGGSAGHSCLRELIIDEGSRLGGGDRVWHTQVLDLEQVETLEAENKNQRENQRKQTLALQDREKVIQALAANTDRGQTATDVQNLTGISRRRPVAGILESLVSEGIAQATLVRKNNGQEYPAFLLVRMPTWPSGRRRIICPSMKLTRAKRVS